LNSVNSRVSFVVYEFCACAPRHPSNKLTHTHLNQRLTCRRSRASIINWTTKAAVPAAQQVPALRVAVHRAAVRTFSSFNEMLLHRFLSAHCHHSKDFQPTYLGQSRGRQNAVDSSTPVRNRADGSSRSNQLTSLINGCLRSVDVSNLCISASHAVKCCYLREFKVSITALTSTTSRNGKLNVNCATARRSHERSSVYRQHNCRWHNAKPAD
jgi:hypothetical protein